jgi:hypothetical protein
MNEEWKNKIVKFSPNKEAIKMWGKQIKKIPFKIEETYLCLGEIGNMPEHFIFVDIKGKIYWAYHNDFFKILTEDEV